MRRPGRTAAAAALALVPPLVALALVLAYAVDVVVWDEWAIADLLIRWKEGTLRFEHLFVQHNEHRIFFPKVIFLALALATGWDVRAEMLLTFALSCLVAWNLWRLARATLSPVPWKAALVLAVMNVLVFSPAQHENWLWGFQALFFAPIVAITSALALAHSRVGARVAVGGSIALAAVATFSLANGMLAWVLVPPALLAARWDELRPRLVRVAVLWAGCAALAIGAYLRGFGNPGGQLARAVLESPGEVARFYLAFLGTFLRIAPADWALRDAGPAMAIGGTVLALFLLLAGSLAAARSREALLRAAPWLTIGAHVLVTAALTSAGRFQSGVTAALESRYATFSLYLPVAVVGLAVVAWDLASRRSAAAARAGALAGGALVAVLLLLHVGAGDAAVARMKAGRDLRRSAVAAQHFGAVVDEPWLGQRFTYQPLPEYRERLAKLDAAGLLGSGLARDTAIEPYARSETAPGLLERFARAGDGRWIAEGWAMLPGRRWRTDAVLFTYVDAEGRERIFTLTDWRVDRPDVAAALGLGRYALSGFGGVLEARPPPGAVAVRAWAYDAIARRAYRIAGEERLERTAHVPGAR